MSDIGIAFLLADPLAATDAEQKSALAAYCTATHARHGRRPSIFWFSPAAFAAADDLQVTGRFPAVDRLDLLQHSRPIAGTDLRSSLVAPRGARCWRVAARMILRLVRNPACYGAPRGGYPHVPGYPRVPT